MVVSASYIYCSISVCKNTKKRGFDRRIFVNNIDNGTANNAKCLRG